MTSVRFDSLAPLARPLGLPVHVEVSPTAPFSTALRSARNDNVLEEAFVEVLKAQC
jgi:hypothetical protein